MFFFQKKDVLLPVAELPSCYNQHFFSYCIFCISVFSILHVFVISWVFFFFRIFVHNSIFTAIIVFYIVFLCFACLKCIFYILFDCNLCNLYIHILCLNHVVLFESFRQFIKICFFCSCLYSAYLSPLSNIYLFLLLVDSIFSV